MISEKTPKKSYYNLPLEELEKLLDVNGFSKKYATKLYTWYYKKNLRRSYDHQDISILARNFVSNLFDFELPQISQALLSEDKTVKFKMRLADKNEVESVLIPFQSKYTLCVSSQVGCSMKCTFCYTGTQGFSRHLECHEIVGQFLQAKQWLTENRPNDDKILNVVFMGQGEPLHNFDNVKVACQILTEQAGVSLANHKITVSTSGYLPGLKRWKSEMPPVNLALSLHSTFNEKRDKLIPLNKKYPLSEIVETIQQIPLDEKRFITCEFLLAGGFNDSDVDAHALGEFSKDKRFFINIIPFNPFPNSEFKRPSPETIERFANIVSKYGSPVTVRTTKGEEILAACGQLNTKQ